VSENPIDGKPKNNAPSTSEPSPPPPNSDESTGESIIVEAGALIEGDPDLHHELNAEIEALLHSPEPLPPSPSIKELLNSSDPPSRFVTFLALGFALIALMCVGLFVSRYLDMKRGSQPVEVKQESLPAEKIITEPLGEFKLVLKGADHPTEGELRVDIVAECTNAEACQYLKDHLAQARDIVIPVLINARRADLLNPDGKTLIRKRITEQLNSLPMNGKIIQVLFTDLTIE
jgi:flagellar basal body-associated protein FliL